VLQSLVVLYSVEIGLGYIMGKNFPSTVGFLLFGLWRSINLEASKRIRASRRAVGLSGPKRGRHMLGEVAAPMGTIAVDVNETVFVRERP
jgi:hypothetical protein